MIWNLHRVMASNLLSLTNDYLINLFETQFMKLFSEEFFNALSCLVRSEKFRANVLQHTVHTYILVLQSQKDDRIPLQLICLITMETYIYCHCYNVTVCLSICSAANHVHWIQIRTTWCYFLLACT